MRRITTFILMSALSLLSCRDNVIEPPPPRIATITLLADHVGIAEATLRIQISDTMGAKQFRLTRDHQPVLSAQYTGADTSITDTTLLRGRSYLYKAFRLQDTVVIDSSEAVLVQTIDSASIQLSVEPLVTEAELQITINDRNPIRGYRIERDNIRVASGTMIGKDTVLVDFTLAPFSSHSYKVFRVDDNTDVDSTPLVSFTTLDTTSHDFTWQVDTVGAITSSLFDIAILDENKIWAVGEIYGRDSTGQIEPQQYNLAKYESNSLSINRVLFPVCNGDGTDAGMSPFIAVGILAFNQSDIWLTSGGSFAHWNGSSFSRMCLRFDMLQGGLLKMWGSSSNNLYAVGGNGTIIKYNGLNWQAINSPTNVHLLDIFGSPDGSVVWACGWSDFKPTVLLRMQNNTWEKVYENNNRNKSMQADFINGNLKSVWTGNKNRVYVLTDLNLYECSLNTKGTGRPLWDGNSPDIWAFNLVRGTAVNNIVTVGYGGRIWHFNGLSWKSYDNILNPLDILYSVSITENEIVAVGERYYNGIERYGVIYRGSR